MKDQTKPRWGADAKLEFRSPNYKRAPVIETSLAVRFAAPQKWNIHIFGLLQEQLFKSFPIFETAPPLPLQEAGKIQFTFPPAAPRVRALYWSQARDRLIQLQDNIFCMNWQKAATAVRYPRYKSLRSDFVREWDAFVTLAGRVGVGPFEIAGCSVTYINKVDASSSLGPSDLCAYLAQPPENVAELGLIVAAETVSVMLTRDSQQITYLVQPAIQLTDNTKITQVTLVAETKSISPSGDDLMPRLDSAHQLLIETFETLTSTRAQAMWGKE